MKLTHAIIAGGLLAGLGDIAYACIHSYVANGTAPERILQSVAAGLVGPDAARSGGWGTAALGLVAHFSMTLIMALVFNLAATVLPLLRRMWALTGPLYGVALMFVMNLVVVPLSAAGRPVTLPPGQFLYGAIFAHTILVGLVIAWFASRVRKA